MVSIFGLITVIFFTFILTVVFMAGYKAKKPLFSSNLSKWLIIIYSAVLVISGILLYVLPIGNTSKQWENGDKNRTDAYAIANEFGNIVKSGKLKSHKEIYKNQSYKFDYIGNEISLSDLGENGGYFDLWIERKDTDDGIIEADSYVTKVSIFSEDITEKLQPPSIRLIGNTLSIIPAETYKIDYKGFNDDFTSAQFSYGAVNRFSNLAPFIREIIHLRIPKSVNINDKYMGALYVNYIN